MMADEPETDQTAEVLRNAGYTVELLFITSYGLPAPWRQMTVTRPD